MGNMFQIMLILADIKQKTREIMKPLNLSGKILVIPMASLPQNTKDAIQQEDGMQAAFGTNIFVYATGRVFSGCCCGHHHGEEGHHHHEHEEGHECCGGHHHHEHEEGHECCGGHHHHEHEEGHECCGGHHHHEHEEGHECCGGHHHHEHGYNAGEADETYFGQEDLAYGKDEPILETIDDNLLLVINEPVAIVNTSDAERIGFDAAAAKYFELPPDGITLVPGKDVDKEGFQTGPISIQLKD